MSRSKATSTYLVAPDARKVPVLRYFVPFLKTPYNAFKYVFRDRTPLGLMSPEIRSQIMRGSKPGATAIDKKVSDMAVARMSMGSIASVAFAYLTMQGHMIERGHLTEDYKQPYVRKAGVHIQSVYLVRNQKNCLWGSTSVTPHLNHSRLCSC